VIFTQYIKNHFGSKRGLLRAFVAEIARKLGCYKHLDKVDFRNVKRLVFVCHGNICRSPLGEAAAKRQGFTAISYGLDTRGGAHADPRAIAFGDAHQILFREHKTRQIKQYQPCAGDLLIGMEPRHARHLKKLYGADVQITLAGLWLKAPAAYLHDPYNANAIFFNRCESLVVQAADNLVQKVKEQQ